MELRLIRSQVLAMISIAVSACGVAQIPSDTHLTATALVLNDQMANHAYALGLGQTVALQLINRSAPAMASDPSVIKRIETSDTSTGRVTIFQAVATGVSRIEPGPISCGQVACENTGIPGTTEEFFILVTSSTDPVAVVLTLSDQAAILALRRDEHAAIVLPNRDPFGPWVISDGKPDAIIAKASTVTSKGFTWATFTAVGVGQAALQASATPACAQGAVGCPVSPREFSTSVLVSAAGVGPVVTLTDKDNGTHLELKTREVLELVLRLPPFDTGGGSVVASHPNVMARVSDSGSPGLSTLDFQARDSGLTQLLSAGPKCTSSSTCPSLFEVSVFVFP